MTARNILIIEDDPSLLRGLKDNFVTAGYVVRTATDGQRGLDSLLRGESNNVLFTVTSPTPHY